MFDGKPLAGPGMRDTWFMQPLHFELGHQAPRDDRALAALPKRTKPELADVVPERAQGRAVGRHRVIGEVADHDSPKPGSLLWNGRVEVPSQFLLDRRA